MDRFQKTRSLMPVIKGSRLTIAMSRLIKVSIDTNKEIRKSQWERAMYKTYKGLSVSYYVNLSKFMGLPPTFNIEKGKAEYLMEAIKNSSDEFEGSSTFIMNIKCYSVNVLLFVAYVSMFHKNKNYHVNLF